MATFDTGLDIISILRQVQYVCICSRMNERIFSLLKIWIYVDRGIKLNCLKVIAEIFYTCACLHISTETLVFFFSLLSKCCKVDIFRSGGSLELTVSGNVTSHYISQGIISWKSNPSFKNCINILTLWNTQEYQIEVANLHTMVQYEDM